MRPYLLIFCCCVVLSPCAEAGASDWISLVFPDAVTTSATSLVGRRSAMLFPW